MAIRLKYFLLSLIVIVLFAPLLQFKLDLFETTKLDGDLTIAAKPEFKKEDYWNLKWQDEYAKYYNDNFGFRNWFVRLINQLRYSFLNTTTAPGVVIGKNGELFIESYIDEYIGRNYIGKSKIAENVNKIKTLQDSLKVRGKDLIVVFAPGKASFLSELIPDTYTSKKKDSTNYKVYAELFKKSNVNFIDMNKWFVDNKTKFKYPVYPKYGTHWNHYGMSFALDSLLKYIERKRKINLPDFDFSVVNYDSNLKGNDYDVGILMNLLDPIEKEACPYPAYKFKITKGYVKPDVLVVGDSYWSCLVKDDLPIKFFREDEYWFYNKDRYIHNEKREPIKDLNLSASLVQRDVVVLMATEATFYMFPYGFVDRAYKLYCNDNSKRYNEIVADMHRNKEWYNNIVNKAIEHCLFVDDQIKKDAEFIISDELFKYQEELEKNIQDIKNNSQWMADIKNKAKENKVSEEEQIKKDAIWLLEQNKKK